MLTRSIMYRDQHYEVLLDQEEDGGYAVSAPAVPGAYSDGDTEAEALENIVDAIANLKASTAEVAEILAAHDRKDHSGSGVSVPPHESEVVTD